MWQCLRKKLSMTLELCNEIIVLEAAAMLPDNDSEFSSSDSAHEAKTQRWNRDTVLQFA